MRKAFLTILLVVACAEVVRAGTTSTDQSFSSPTVLSKPIQVSTLTVTGKGSNGYSATLSTGIFTPNGRIVGKAFEGDGSALTNLPAGSSYLVNVTSNVFSVVATFGSATFNTIAGSTCAINIGAERRVRIVANIPVANDSPGDYTYCTVSLNGGFAQPGSATMGFDADQTGTTNRVRNCLINIIVPVTTGNYTSTIMVRTSAGTSSVMCASGQVYRFCNINMEALP